MEEERCKNCQFWRQRQFEFAWGDCLKRPVHRPVFDYQSTHYDDRCEEYKKLHQSGFYDFKQGWDAAIAEVLKMQHDGGFQYVKVDDIKKLGGV
jgi:hypothetical protein